ncbi:pinin/SDK/memA/ protein conserved region-domain-containing protein [Radiomyces spectabilis]|uniref:pinin/SDK/memA/ protein conserved region-domain-containing protein n=1 Tax=Radiomyces spectabilis TaxID=64574 RepID=UPI00221F7B59|nr:pinin/SDK/memA/ protein conserved region-domain-containing protein [Radiomyces spectabilis]KAI8381169.1 pinin/SDK/memA/ protein conserved region-domain-containing protein [Radiomyces spectabilis]
MVKSSIVVPPQATIPSDERKRPLDQPSSGEGSSSAPNEDGEAKRPRLDLSAAGKKRGQRLFGVLLGTLNKFKDDNEQMSETEKRRQEINQKLRERLAQEKEETAKRLQAEREAKEVEKRRLLKQREEEREFKALLQKEHLANFIQTRATPSLCYRPNEIPVKLLRIIDQQVEDARKERVAFEERRQQRRNSEAEPSTLDSAEVDTDTTPAETSEEKKPSDVSSTGAQEER